MECFRYEFVRGTVLGGRFKTISPLNHGSFGMVFVAQDLLTDQPVAIKCLTRKAATNGTATELAIDDRSDELLIHAGLTPHVNIVNLLHSFESEAHLYLVMEFCSQGDLYEAIRNGHGPLQTDHVRHFMLQLVDAIAHIHSKGVFHRDVKPENIFLTSDGNMKLGDFGLATTDKWSYEMTVGSDRYMAPEQFDSAGAGYSPAAADIWAVGICLLNILFSRNPFATPTEADPIFLDFSRDKQSLFDVFPTMSQDTYEVIVQCMNLDPKRRSLVSAREALLRAVSFTMEDEVLDDFCGAESTTIATANREPLRTPSIQSPQLDFGAFPWTKATHPNSIGQLRQLSVIPDESYSEDIFSKSVETSDWCVGGIQTPSISSIPGSHLGVSVPSAEVVQSSQSSQYFKISPTAGSLPIAVTKRNELSFPSPLNRRNDAVSKSWSDMWDEDEEAKAYVQGSSIPDRFQPRALSHRARFGLDTSVPSLRGLKHDACQEGGFGAGKGESCGRSGASRKLVSCALTPHSLSRRLSQDKWAALGEKRRAQILPSKPNPRLPQDHQRLPDRVNERPDEGSLDWCCLDDHKREINSSSFGKGASRFVNWSRGRDRLAECSWNKNRNWNWRRERRIDIGDLEWMAG